MKNFVWIAGLLVSVSANAGALEKCTYSSASPFGSEIGVIGEEIHKRLKIDTSWVHVEDCPRMVGIKFEGSRGVKTEYHTLVASEEDQSKRIQACRYHFQGPRVPNFMNLTCFMTVE
ncbi:MAG: hypothetical protein EBX52_04500 [Proteobacteria bacterium]|nr:hypothetical protein [Pseudomonadota bacterium]